VAIDNGAGSESCKKDTLAILLSCRHIWAGFLGLDAALEAAAAWSFLPTCLLQLVSWALIIIIQDFNMLIRCVCM